jgi:hypothetical protein
MAKFIIIFILIAIIASAMLFSYLQKLKQQPEEIIIPEPLYRP